MLSLRAIATATLVAWIAAAPARAANAKDVLIGYVNVQRAIVEVEEGKRAKDALKATFEKKQKALSDKETQLKKLKDDIDKAGNDPASAQKKQEFQSKLME